MLIGKAGEAKSALCTADAERILVRGRDLSRDLDVPPFILFTDKTLQALATALPLTRRWACAFLRAAVFLWSAPRAAALSIVRTSSRCSEVTRSASPSSTARSSRFASVLIVER